MVYQLASHSGWSLLPVCQLDSDGCVLCIVDCSLCRGTGRRVSTFNIDITRISWFSVLVSTILEVLLISFFCFTAITRWGIGSLFSLFSLLSIHSSGFEVLFCYIYLLFWAASTGLFSPFSILRFVLFSFALDFDKWMIHISAIISGFMLLPFPLWAGL